MRRDTVFTTLFGGIFDFYLACNGRIKQKIGSSLLVVVILVAAMLSC